MKKIMKNATRALVLICAMFMAFSCGGAVDKALQQAVDQMAAACPQQVDEITTLDKVELEEGRNIVMSYTVALDKNAEDFDLESFTEAMKTYLVDGVKAPAMASLRTFEVTMTYIYLDENGEEILNYPITPEMYK